jgi:trans-aconitate methyltransferase
VDHCIKYLEAFSKLVEKGRTVLDIGCGDGKPVDEYLIEQGLAVNGIDSSKRMIELAKKNVPEGFYEVKDVLSLKEGEYCVSGIVSLNAVFQTPREKHQGLLRTLASFIPDGGFILIAMELGELEGTEEHLHTAKLPRAHYRMETNSEIIENAGFEILSNVIDESGKEKHQIIIARR